ncbi:hypothetical protein AAIG33_20585 [Phytobacter ursingii]|uniref:hypothetical protein n=1 Tax=Phytobacter ursingii TaxID=1972431 RepID=UPI0031B77C62
MTTDKELTDDVLDEIIAGAKTAMEQYLALSLKAERAALQSGNSAQPVTVPADWITDEVINAAYERHLYGIMSGTGNKRAAIDFLNECLAAIVKTAKGV